MKSSNVFLPVFILVSATVLSLACILSAEEPVKPKPIEQTVFVVIGIEDRTNNTRETAEGGIIPQQWQRFYMEGTINQIPDKSDHSIIAVYTDYASDANGDYSYVLGARVKPGTKPPAGMVAKEVPAGKYLLFTSEQGALPLVVPKLWRHIYEYFQGTGVPQRAFKADYEVYDSAMDPNNASAKIYIGVK